MTRINLKLIHGVAFTEIFKIREMALGFAKRGRQRSSKWRLPILLFMAPIVLQLCAVSAAAQLSIVVVEKNRRPVPLPTREVGRILGVRRGAPQQITILPLNLEVGDELVGNSDVIEIRVRCNSAEASISGKFRVRMLPSSAPACNLFFQGSAGARLNATASGPTSVVSGAFTLGTRRTRYEIEIPKKKGGGLLSSIMSAVGIPIAKVFEGEAKVIAPGFSGAVMEGQKLVTGGIRKIESEDYLRAAELYANIDVSQAVKDEKLELSAIFLKFNDKPETQVKQRAVELVTLARAGSDFCALALRYSEAPIPERERCKLGTFSMAELPPETAQVLKNTQVGGISDPVRSSDGYQILHVDARHTDTFSTAEFNAAYLKLLSLHREVLETPHDLSKIAALAKAQQELAIPPTNPAIQQTPPKNTNEMTLNANEKRAVSFTVNNSCNVPMTFNIVYSGTFVRLVSAARVVVNPGGQGVWKFEYDATGLKPGTYEGEILISCESCGDTQCVYQPENRGVTLNVL
jgi:hypothetical protein